ncbi:MAG TPA: Hsp20/alpha crystallin family protein [Thermoplasmata archaeon]|nr:Hsp20/alpha crystallin family protein [Thermoplasmata archaeon]
MTETKISGSGNETAIAPNAPQDLWSQFDELFEQFHQNFYSNFGTPLFRWAPTARGSSLAPAFADVVDQGEKFELTAELPGADKKGIEVTVQGSSVLVKARHAEQTQDKGQNYLRRERVWSGFEREFELPEPIRPDEVTAHYDNGVLTVSVPKAHPVVAKQVVVQ